jgi:hypothetical protein
MIRPATPDATFVAEDSDLVGKVTLARDDA